MERSRPTKSIPLYTSFNIQSCSDSSGKKPAKNLHGKYGVLTVCLVDPLSQLINKISGMKPDDVNAVGFYYESELHGTIQSTVILFNIYDNSPISWLKLGYTMDLLLACPFVSKITYYPLIEATESDSSLFSKSTMRTGVPKRPDKLFRATIVEEIGSNAKNIIDKNIGYTGLLFRISNITGNDVDKITNNIITGYTIVNKVLLTLMKVKASPGTKIAHSIIPCPLLKQHITVRRSQDEIKSDPEIKFVIEESRREITNLISVFIDLFTTHDGFRNHILNTRFNKSDNIEGILNRESELITHIVGGFQNGILSTETLNADINNLMTERNSLGIKTDLPLIHLSKSNIQVLNDTITCSFASKQPVKTVAQDSEALGELGFHINNLALSFAHPEQITFNLGNLISSYNRAINGTNLKKISLPNTTQQNTTISRGCIITLPSTSDEINIPPLNLQIPMYNPDLTQLTESQLLDILVYIDSLRSSDGTYDNRFTNLQNEITHELSHRSDFTHT